LNIVVITNQSDKVQNLAVLKTRLNLSERPLLLSLCYSSKSTLGTATFKVGIDYRNEDKLLFIYFKSHYGINKNKTLNNW